MLNKLKSRFKTFSGHVKKARLLSRKEERHETDNNKGLFNVIIVIYGAVFSYAFYVDAQIITNTFDFLSSKNVGDPKRLPYISDYIEQILAASFITAYMLEDIGSMNKYHSQHHYKRCSLFMYEAAIAFLYLLTFSLVISNDFYSLLPFCLLIGVSGLWLNNFKEENDKDSTIQAYLKNQRDAYYILFAVLLFHFTFFTKYIDGMSFSFLNIGIFGIILFLFLVITPLQSAFKYGKLTMDFGVNAVLPDWIIQLAVTQGEKYRKKHHSS